MVAFSHDMWIVEKVNLYSMYFDGYETGPYVAQGLCLPSTRFLLVYQHASLGRLVGSCVLGRESLEAFSSALTHGKELIAFLSCSFPSSYCIEPGKCFPL